MIGISLGLAIFFAFLGGFLAIRGLQQTWTERRRHHLVQLGLLDERATEFKILPRLNWFSDEGQGLLQERRDEGGDGTSNQVTVQFFSEIGVPARYHSILSLSLKSFVLIGSFWIIFGGYRIAEGQLPPLTHGVFILSAALATGILLPEFLMKRFLHHRQQEIEEKAPDLIDLLTLSVEAGLSFDQAVQQTAHLIETFSPRLSKDLQLLSHELVLLPERAVAFDNFVSRTRSDSFKFLKLALMQGEAYGTPIAKSLALVAAESRTRQLAEKEERARRLPVFLSLPLMLLILPPVIVLSTGPGFISLMTTIRGG